MAPQHVLITGASSGIGAALARTYARHGMRLSLTGRDPVRMDEVVSECRAAGGDVFSYIGDVCDAEGLGSWMETRDRTDPVDTVVANAGVGGERVISGAAGEPLSMAHEIIATNIQGVANTIIPLLPRFVERHKGHVVLMSSLAAYIGLPQAPLYSASKAAIRTYGHALRRLLASKGILVTVICPGFVDTPMSASVPRSRPLLWSAERAATHIISGIARGKREINFPLPLYLLAMFAHLLPSWLADSVLSDGNSKGK